MSVRAPGRYEKDLTKYQTAIEQIAQGRTDAAGTFTLAAGATTTTVSAPNVAPGTNIFFSPQTSDAAAAIGTTYILASNVSQGSFIVSHANAGSVDRTFSWVGLG
jgi:hypothetical protein